MPVWPDVHLCRYASAVLARIVVLCLIISLTQRASAQTSPATGFPEWGTFNRDAIDTVNVGNLNIHWQFPILAKKGIGLDFSTTLLHDNSVLQIAPRTGGGNLFQIPSSPDPTDWSVSAPVGGNTGLSNTSYTTQCPSPNQQTQTTVYNSFTF